MKILITKDTLIKSDLALYNSKSFFTTPNIERIFSSGSIFYKHFTTAPSTGMALSSIITSKYPYQLGRNDYVPVSRWLGETIFEFANNLGFDSFFFNHIRQKSFMANHVNAYKFANLNFYSDEDLLDFDKFFAKLPILETNKAFLWFHLPHVIPPRTSLGSDLDVLDDFIGKIYDYYPNCEMFLTSDHGHMNLNKTIMNYGFDLHNSAINVPLLTSSLIESHAVDFPTSHIHICDLIFKSNIQKKAFVIADTAYRFQGHRKIAIISDRFKLVFNKFTNKYELYDYIYDPKENRNLLQVSKWDYNRGRSYKLSNVNFYPFENIIETELKFLMSEFNKIYKKEFIILELYLKLRVVARFVIFNFLGLIRRK